MLQELTSKKSKKYNNQSMKSINIDQSLWSMLDEHFQRQMEALNYTSIVHRCKLIKKDSHSFEFKRKIFIIIWFSGIIVYIGKLFLLIWLSDGLMYNPINMVVED